MKKGILLVLLTFFAVLLYSFSTPIEIDDDLQGNLIFDYQENVKEINGNLWILYYDQTFYPQFSYLKMAKQNENGDFDVIILDSFQLMQQGINLKCSFAVSNSKVNIFYRKPDTIGEIRVFQIHSNNELEDWNISNSIAMYDNIQDYSFRSIADDQYLVMLQSEFCGTEKIHDLYFEINNGLVFTGSDEFYGSVYSKDDIIIDCTPTGNGWPVFHEEVITEGQIIDASTGQNASLSAPMDDIFLGGWQEGFINNESMPNHNINLEVDAFHLTDSMYRDVLCIKIDGCTSTCRYGDYINQTDTLTVYNSFPDTSISNTALGDSIWTNIIEEPQIDWDENTFNLTVFNGSVVTYCETWIEGSISGNQAFSCTEDIYITDDILYNSVTPGLSPSLYTPDSFYLNSNKNIMIAYKSYNTDTGQTQSPNCDGVYIYGCLSALGEPVSSLPVYEYTAGALKADYLHPHGSTPSFDYVSAQNDTIYIAYPDLHKFVYFDMENFMGDQGFLMHSNSKPVGYPCCGYPYEDPEYGDGITPPYGTDFPWYNPVYPESSEDITYYRGEIDLFGSLYERGAHSVFCNGDDTRFHNNNIWNEDYGLFGGNHIESGYDLNIHHDPRLDNNNGYMQGYYILGNRSYELTILKFSNGEENFYEDYNRFWNNQSPLLNQRMLTDVCDNNLAIMYPISDGIRKHIFNVENNDFLTDNSESTFEGTIQSITLDDDIVYFCDDTMIYSWNNSLNSVAPILSGEFDGFDVVNDNNLIWNANWQANDIALNFYFAEENTTYNHLEELMLDNLSGINYLNLNDLQIVVNENQIANLFLHKKENWGDYFYYSHADLSSYTSASDNCPPSQLKLTVSPNPVYLSDRSGINAMISLDNEKPATLEIFNMKGQKLISKRITESGPCNLEMPDTASGLYLSKLSDESHHTFQKVLLIK